MEFSGEVSDRRGKNVQHMDDEKIISLYWKRDERAVSETQAKYGRLCYSVAYKITGIREDSEECVNDTYVRLWNTIPPEEPDNFAGYTCRITRNLAIDRVKAYSADKRHGAVAIMDELEACFPSRDDAEMAVDRMAITRAFERFLSSIPPAHRMIFMRRYFYLDQVGDIAHTLKMTEVGVRVALHRIRKKLKTYLEEEGVTI